jgi:hypothetical protein
MARTAPITRGPGRGVLIGAIFSVATDGRTGIGRTPDPDVSAKHPRGGHPGQIGAPVGVFGGIGILTLHYFFMRRLPAAELTLSFFQDPRAGQATVP